MLITVNKTCYKNVEYDSVVLFLIFIDTWGITTITFRGCSELINKKVSNICWVLQGTVLIKSHASDIFYLIIWCCKYEAKNYDWGSFGCSMKYSQHSSLFTHYNEHWSKALDGSHIIERKVNVYKLSWLNVSGVNSCVFS